MADQDPQRQPFSDDDLRQLMTDPRLTAADMALLSPIERQRFAQLKAGAGGADAEGDGEGSTFRRLSEGLMGALTGATKGAAKTTSAAVGLVPGVTRATNAVGNSIGGKLSEILYGKEAVAEPVTPGQSRAALEPQGTAEKVGQGIEQAAEYFVPANAARKAAITPLVKYGIPNSASPGTMKILNKLYAILGRTTGEAGSAAMVADLQDEDPTRAAAFGAAGPLVGEAGAMGVNALHDLMKTKSGREIVPYLAAILSGTGMLGAGLDPGTTALGAGLTGFGLKRRLAGQLLESPTVMNKAAKGMRVVGPAAARLAAGSGDKREP